MPTALFCDVVPDPIKGVDISSGILVQAMPGTDLSRMNSIVEKLANGGWADLLIGYGDNWLALLDQLAPDAEPLRDGNLKPAMAVPMLTGKGTLCPRDVWSYRPSRDGIGKKDPRR